MYTAPEPEFSRACAELQKEVQEKREAAPTLETGIAHLEASIERHRADCEGIMTAHPHLSDMVSLLTVYDASPAQHWLSQHRHQHAAYASIAVHMLAWHPARGMTALP